MSAHKIEHSTSQDVCLLPPPHLPPNPSLCAQAYPYGGLPWFTACFLPPSGAALFATALLDFELSGSGVRPSTLFTPITQDGAFSVFSILSLLLFDVFLWGALTWYADKVLPKEYGQRLPFWFVLSPAYWGWNSDSQSGHSQKLGAGIGNHGKAVAGEEESESEDRVSRPLLSEVSIGGGVITDGGSGTNWGSSSSSVGGGEGSSSTLDARGHFAGGSGKGAAVSVRGLRKVFPSTRGGVTEALRGVDLDIPSCRITAMLGHNGAGERLRRAEEGTQGFVWCILQKSNQTGGIL